MRSEERKMLERLAVRLADVPLDPGPQRARLFQAMDQVAMLRASRGDLPVPVVAGLVHRVFLLASQLEEPKGAALLDSVSDLRRWLGVDDGAA